MHRLVLFAKPVNKFLDPEMLHVAEVYGKLYSGDDEEHIMDIAKDDYLSLWQEEEWWMGDEGKKFREEEHWTVDEEKTKETDWIWWIYDKEKYTFSTVGEIPDQFRQRFMPVLYISMVSEWVPISLSDFDNDDHLRNETLYKSLISSPSFRWKHFNESDDDFPF